MFKRLRLFFEWLFIPPKPAVQPPPVKPQTADLMDDYIREVETEIDDVINSIKAMCSPEHNYNDWMWCRVSVTCLSKNIEDYTDFIRRRNSLVTAQLREGCRRTTPIAVFYRDAKNCYIDTTVATQNLLSAVEAFYEQYRNQLRNPQKMSPNRIEVFEHLHEDLMSFTKSFTTIP